MDREAVHSVTQSRRAWRVIHIKVTYYSIFIELFSLNFHVFVVLLGFFFMVVFQLITAACLLFYVVMPPPRWNGDRGLLLAWSNAWLLLVARWSCLFQDLSGKTMVNVKTVSASLYFLPTSPTPLLSMLASWRVKKHLVMCDLRHLRHSFCCSLLGAILFLQSGKLFRKNCFTWPFFLESCGLESVSHGGDGVFFPKWRR